MKIPTPEELEALPTLSVGQDADLKIDDGELRVWLSRCGPEDGATHRVEVEYYSQELGMWRTSDYLFPFE